jgi:RNA polymerase sigma-70 factor (ECF subfamily)
MRLRSRKRKPTVALEEVGLQFDETGHMVGELPPWKKLPDSLLERKELVKMLLEAAEGLPEGYREVWVLVDQEELAMQEVGEILGLSVGNVKTRLHRARMMLREVLVEKLGGRR